jgi:hypothetical protein
MFEEDFKKLFFKETQVITLMQVRYISDPLEPFVEYCG